MNSIFCEAVNVDEFIKYNGDTVLSNKKRTKKNGMAFQKPHPVRMSFVIKRFCQRTGIRSLFRSAVI